jgi:hypothetical protein
VRLHLHQPRVYRGIGGFDLRATFTFAPGTLPEAEVGFHLDDPDHRATDPTVLPFLPAAVVLACRTNQDLVVSEPVPPAAHRGAEQVAALLHRWYGWRPAELIAPLGAEPASPPGLAHLVGRVARRRPRGVGVFFTRGVDSWSTLLERLDGPAGERPTHLITVDLDVHHDPELRRRGLAETAEVAQALGLPLIVVRTDIRAVLDPYLNWGTEAHGSVLAGIGWLLRPVLREVVIAPTLSTSLLQPWGSHPDLDPCWSLPDLTVTHHDSDAPRWQRIERIAREPVALRSLQVCWQGVRQRNCGRCEKCLRTMTSLEVSGYGHAIDAVFDEPLTLDAVGPDVVVNPHPWCETIDHLDHVGLAADRWRQRWELVERRARPNLVYQQRAIQPRIPVETGPGVELADVGPALARIGVRVDHERSPADQATPALAVRRDPHGERSAHLRLPGSQAGTGPSVAVAELRLADLEPLLDALGADPDDAVAFDPAGHPPPAVVR